MLSLSSCTPHEIKPIWIVIAQAIICDKYIYKDVNSSTI